MISNTKWMTYAEYLPIELMQSADEGRDVESFRERVEEVMRLPLYSQEREKKAFDLLNEIEKIPIRQDFPYREPDALEDILSLRDKNGGKRYHFDELSLFDKIHGAWMGRCSGCLLGQPIEGWRQKRIEGYLRDTDNYPVRRYFSSDQPQEIIERYQISNNGENAFCDDITHWINNITIMPEDDDTNYTVVGLKVLEKHGFNFTSDHIAEMWLTSLPMGHVSTAERVAYRNIGNLVEPPRSGWWKNPYREWIGAQIRADIFGYVCPGDPEKAAALAWRDARISHVKNGIYGEMFVAAMLASAFSISDPTSIIRAGLSEIPKTSRLYRKVVQILERFEQGISFEDALEQLHNEYDERQSHIWCHTITNAVVVAIALLYGGMDFEKSIGLAMLCGFDTDCNGATVGSILGLVNGYDALPDQWTKPVGSLLRTGVSGFAQISIRELAERTFALVEYGSVT